MADDENFGKTISKFKAYEKKAKALSKLYASLKDDEKIELGGSELLLSELKTTENILENTRREIKIVQDQAKQEEARRVAEEELKERVAQMQERAAQAREAMAQIKSRTKRKY